MSLAPAAVLRRRVLLVVASLTLLGGAAATQLQPATPSSHAPDVADQLLAGSWAMNVPIAWLAAPAPHVRAGDALDILAVKQGDHAYAVPVAFDVMVVSADDRTLVLAVSEEDASAIAIARGGGLLLIPLLRPTR